MERPVAVDGCELTVCGKELLGWRRGMGEGGETGQGKKDEGFHGVSSLRGNIL